MFLALLSMTNLLIIELVLQNWLSVLFCFLSYFLSDYIGGVGDCAYMNLPRLCEVHFYM